MRALLLGILLLVITAMPAFADDDAGADAVPPPPGLEQLL